LFDFDGTITKKDTLFVFTRYYHGSTKLILGLVFLSPLFLLFALKMLSNQRMKEIFLTWFFRNENIEYFDSRCKTFTEEVKGITRPLAMSKLEEYKKDGNIISVVSASPINWVKPWCDQYNIKCIATKLEIKEGRLTGKIVGNNCYGKEKVRRIKEHFTLESFNEIHAYGDSKGDKEMLAIASIKFYKPFLP